MEPRTGQRWAAWALALGLATAGAAAVGPSGGAPPDDVPAAQAPRTSVVATFPSRVRVSVLDGIVHRLDVRVLGLPAVRLTPVRLPAGFRIRRGRYADVVVGRVQQGKQVLVVWARRVGAASTTRQRVHIVIVGRGPTARPGTVLVTRGVDGSPADGLSWDPLVSGDGDTVLFTSTATNLVRRRLEPGAHLYAWDRRTHAMELVGLLPDGSPAVATASDVSEDGDVLLFTTDPEHQWMRDRDAFATVAVEPTAELTSAGRLVTYPDVPPPGWLTTGAASGDGRYLGLRLPDRGCALPDGGQVALAVWDVATGAVVHQAQVGCGEGSSVDMRDLTDDGRLALVQWNGAHDIGGNVVDMATGAMVVLDALDISGDARRVLTRTRWSGITLMDRATDHTVRLVKPYAAPGADAGGLFTTGTVSRDAADVAYVHDGDDLLRGVTSRFAQVYLWHDASR